ncbi:hypothetical protein ABE41_005850 [Fictibacillus arsenicus]|uniref:Uncharacterized protein n=1 Tax=Fictibacillus arsenicus TaxID=255247 RepID=A0A1B1Z2B1_9BACL|nr:hypothetical protein ABE41_005850 [Fictibacillus arsenicus]
MTRPMILAIAGIKAEIEGRKILRISIRTMIAYSDQCIPKVSMNEWELQIDASFILPYTILYTIWS